MNSTENSKRDVYLIHSIISQKGIIDGKAWENTCFICIDDSRKGCRQVKTFKGGKELAECYFDEEEHYRLLFDSSGRVCEFITLDT